MSLFENVEIAPTDPILGITTAFKADPSADKVNLGVGAYRTESGAPYVLDVVKKVEREIVNSNFDHEYIPIDGLAEFLKHSAALIFGENSIALKEARVGTVQALSGTGALRIGMQFIKRWFSAGTTVYVSNPTWSNHQGICQNVGLPWKEYRYLNSRTLGLDFEGMVEDLRNAPDKSVILLHVCAHNPTGVDPTPEQWQKIADVMREKQHFPFFDSAYQGFASGDLDRDAYSVRLFVERGFELFCTQSYAKNMGLYGERIGAFNVVCSKKEVIEATKSQLRIIIRTMYSSPPTYGARIAAAILGNRENFELWKKELVIMSSRIASMRKALFERLQQTGTPGRWSHIVEQIGMFSYTGLKPAQVDILTKKYHIYLVSNGRVSMAGFNTSNVNYVADAIKDAVLSAP